MATRTAKEICPQCGSGGVLRSASRLRHWGRVLTRSKKRFCPTCQEKWHTEAPVAHEVFSKEEKLIAAFVLGTPIVLFLTTNPYAVRDWIKTRVRAYYDQKYGPDSQAQLWHDFGRLYGRPNAAIMDYGTHGKK